jgi:flagellin-specific chaperone FliS
MVQGSSKTESQEEKIKKLEERVRELESLLELQQREEPDDELNDLYRRRRELLSGLVVEKDDAKNKELWESLPAIERQKYARWVFEERKKDLGDIDARIEQLRSGKDGLRERR